MDAAIRAVQSEQIQYTSLVCLDRFTEREKETKMGKELLLLLCFWHGLAAFSQQRLHQSQGMLEGAVSDYTAGKGSRAIWHPGEKSGSAQEQETRMKRAQ